ncbi:MAG: hypothetical protein ACFB4J_17515 [Elainellaceae cyanobacterium]
MFARRGPLLVMQRYREFLPQAPEALCPFLALQVVPSAPPFPEALWGQKVCTLVVCYSGPQNQVMCLYLLVYNLGQRQLRQGLEAAGHSLPIAL